MARRKIKHREGIPKKKRKSQKPRFDVVSLREAVAGIKPEKPICESADGSRKKEPVAKLSPSGRKCDCCGATLSFHNSDKLCWPCDRAIQHWKLFPMERSQNERSMAPHCLAYAREKFSRKDGSGNTLDEEMPGGSWVRSVGRRKR